MAVWMTYSSMILMGAGVSAGEINNGNWTLSHNVLSLEGEILPQSSRHFRRLYAAAMLSIPYPKPIVIELDCTGGDLAAAIRIVRIIRAAQREKTTVTVSIRSGKRCYSTCLLLFAAANHRQAAPGALFRFPSSANSDVTLRILSSIAEVDADLANHLLKMGFPDEVQTASQLGYKYLNFVTLQE
ncbi:hypothetical protein LP7551_00257 [Roseibium album]|nr:hypothetical protein LP7551_00257 [Roseibium album]